ncbi:50S ribosomal protein L23 [Candidatus Wolfebacteria bacterium]|nr:50S ribosomal protein L23 [Candidatus Wolfebacteria bacterium]
MGIFTRKKINTEEKPVKEIKSGISNAEKQALIKSVPKQLSFLLKQVWMTEKSANFANERKYVFIIDKNANKPQVKKAIEAVYGVKVLNINIVNQKSKKKRLGRSIGVVPGKKKAIITLKEGNKLNF